MVIGTSCSWIFSYFGMMIDYKPSFERTVKTTKDLNDAAVEYIDGIEVIKAFGKTESSYAKFTKAAMEYADSFISWMKRCSIFQAMLMVVTPYTLLTVLPFGAHYVENGTLMISSFVMCIILSLGIVGPIITVVSYTDDLGKIGVIIDEVVGILKQPELKRPEKSTAVPKDNSITLTDVKFGYHEKEILHGVSMKLEAGTVNAIVGPSGSGKSTIAKLIASLWDVNSGSIKIGGVNVRQMSLTDFNQKIAYVAQDNYLFNESVRENIRQGNPNATDEQIIEVTKRVAAMILSCNLKMDLIQLSEEPEDIFPEVRDSVFRLQELCLKMHQLLSLTRQLHTQILRMKLFCKIL